MCFMCLESFGTIMKWKGFFHLPWNKITLWWAKRSVVHPFVNYAEIVHRGSSTIELHLNMNKTVAVGPRTALMIRWGCDRSAHYVNVDRKQPLPVCHQKSYRWRRSRKQRVSFGAALSCENSLTCGEIWVSRIIRTLWSHDHPARCYSYLSVLIELSFEYQRMLPMSQNNLL